jgi:hypothetical protein
MYAQMHWAPCAAAHQPPTLSTPHLPTTALDWPGNTDTTSFTHVISSSMCSCSSQQRPFSAPKVPASGVASGQ